MACIAEFVGPNFFDQVNEHQRVALISKDEECHFLTKRLGMDKKI